MATEAINGFVAQDFHKDNSVNPQRYDEFINLLKKYGFKNGQSLIDLGCGSGELEVLLSLKFPDSKIIGIDVSKDMIKLAKSYSKEKIQNVEFYVWDLADLAKKPFNLIADFAVSRHTFHRLNNLSNGFKTILSLVKSGGIIINNSFVNIKEFDEEGFKKWVLGLRERNSAPENQMAWALAHYNAHSLEDYKKALAEAEKTFPIIKKEIWLDDKGYGSPTLKCYAIKK